MSTLRIPARSGRSMRPWQRVGCHATPLRWQVENPVETWPSETSRRIAVAGPQPQGNEEAIDAALLGPEQPGVMLGGPVGVVDHLRGRHDSAFLFLPPGA